MDERKWNIHLTEAGQISEYGTVGDEPHNTIAVVPEARAVAAEQRAACLRDVADSLKEQRDTAEAGRDAMRDTIQKLREIDTAAYRNAMVDDGPLGSLGYDWRNKPHRLVYDLCKAIELALAASVSKGEGPLAFEEGVAAYRAGKMLYTNPYKAGEYGHGLWLRGWTMTAEREPRDGD